ncbi:MAG TPA: hypothetical protein VMY18_00245, partial [Acidobacteriota bacterium]|nr:hypothetical protein [Acidobacteriota bacterium]
TLESKTIKAFDGYVGPLEREFLLSIDKGTPGLWMASQQERASARSGRILVRKVESVPDIPGGILHFWEGLVFIPDIKAEAVVDLLTDYDRQKDVYPEIVDSRLISRQDEKIRGYLRLKKEKVLTVVLNTEHEAKVLKGSDGRTYILSHSTRIAEVRNPGEPSEKELPVGKDSGFLWRMNAYWAIEQVEDGVLLECASVSLSREIPWGLGWMIRPFVESTPREALEEMLQATRVELHQ